MKAGTIGFAASILLVAALALAQTSPGPSVMATTTPIKPPLDRPYPGEIRLDVDASDVSRHLVHVHESLSGVGPGTVLLYPKWLPGTHAPEGTIDRLAGLQITAGGKRVPWTRDPADVFAFRIHPPAGTQQVDIELTYLAPTSPNVGDMESSPDLLMIEWNELVLYPAGYYTRRIPASVSLTLPAGWKFGTALEVGSTNGAQSTFKTVPLETLVDSPLYAGRYTARLDLDPGAPVAVHLDLFADRAQFLEVKPEQLAAYRSLVQQAYKLFGSHHYAHYDFLYSLSDQIQQSGLEHHQSSENGTDPDAFTSWEKTSMDRDLLPHEYTHSWNGKFRRPADLWTPNYNVAMQDSLLWVYEGQTQYWGQVLAARSGLRTRQEALDEIALTAAYYDILPGRQWRPVQDTTNDEIINPRRPLSWRDWQRFEDYYEEGELIWLEADTLIRERSNGKRSLDDFAKAFFGIDNGSYSVLTYTFEDIVKALNVIEPYDWASFLRQRLDSVGRPAPLEGLRRGGYRLIYTDQPNELEKASDAQRKRVSLLYSIGLGLEDKDTKGLIREVLWNGPAFKARLTAGGQILSVNGVAYDEDVLNDAIRLAQTASAPIELIVKTGDRYSVAHVDYHGGLRYPHLERDPSTPARLDEILAAKP
jgi:predicted metalloprotease with PDZ domain